MLFTVCDRDYQSFGTRKVVSRGGHYLQITERRVAPKLPRLFTAYSRIYQSLNVRKDNCARIVSDIAG